MIRGTVNKNALSQGVGGQANVSCRTKLPKSYSWVSDSVKEMWGSGDFEVGLLLWRILIYIINHNIISGLLIMTSSNKDLPKNITKKPGERLQTFTDWEKHFKKITLHLDWQIRETCCTPYRKSDFCIPRNETVWPRSQLLHSCICEQFIYSQVCLFLAVAK